MHVPEAAEPPEMTRRFGKYEVREFLGEGGMGKVWLAWDPYLDVYVAIKELHPGISERRLQAEARYIRLLNKSSAVVKVYDFEPQSELHPAYYVMEYMPGEVLGHKDSPYPFENKRRTPGRIEKCIQILVPLAETLDEAHALGIFHGDIKPSNILFDEKNKPRLSDFSIAHWDEPADDVESIPASADPLATAIRPYWAGTPEYMAPEMFISENMQPTKYGDFYSLAVVAFQMLTGRILLKPPEGFDSDFQSRYECYRRQHQDNIVLPAMGRIIKDSKDENLHEGFERVFKKALAKEPSKRYEKATYFIKALKEEMLRGPNAPVRLSELRGILMARTGEGSEGNSAETYRALRRLGVWALGIWGGLTALAVFLWLWGGFASDTPDFVLRGTWVDAVVNGGPRVFAARLLASWVFVGGMGALLLVFWLCRLGAHISARADADRYWKHAGREKALKADLESFLKCAYDQQTTETDTGHKETKFVLNQDDMKLRLRAFGFQDDQTEVKFPERFDKTTINKEVVAPIFARFEEQNDLWGLRNIIKHYPARPAKNRPKKGDFRRTEVQLSRAARVDLVAYGILLALALPALWFVANEFGFSVMFWATSGLFVLWAAGGLVLWRMLQIERTGRKEAKISKGG